MTNYFLYFSPLRGALWTKKSYCRFLRNRKKKSPDTNKKIIC